LVEHADGRGTTIVIIMISPGPLGEVLLQKLIAVVALAKDLFEQVLVRCQCRCASLCTLKTFSSCPNHGQGIRTMIKSDQQDPTCLRPGMEKAADSTIRHLILSLTLAYLRCLHVEQPCH